jgi:signal transduction histidine kinase
MNTSHSSDNRPKPTAAEAISTTPEKPYRILVADDEPDIPLLFRQMFSKYIRKGIYQFSFVTNGVEALQTLEEDQSFDMLLSDIRMPKMDGLALLEEVEKRYPLIRTVMVTAFQDMDNIRRAMNMGAFDFISKPVQFNDLDTTVKKTLAHVAKLKQLEQAREEHERNQAHMVQELKKLNQLKDEFLANTSHELRTPLNGMVGLIEAILDMHENIPYDMRYNLKLVLASGKRLSSLINDILDFSKLKHEELYINRKPVEVRSLVDIAFTLCTPLRGDKPVTFINDIPEDMVPVFADEDRLQQIMLNLLGNAVKFTDEGSVKVTAELGEDFAKISVIDTGIGISSGKLQEIFDAFSQADGSAERQYGGTGLGLSITNKLVELHQGTIDVSSQLGRGSTFTFTLPLSAESEVQPESDDAVMSLHDSAAYEDDEDPTADPSMDHLIEEDLSILSQTSRILAVDDDKVNLQVVKSQLHQYQVSLAESGAEALEILEKEGPFDLVILDIMMPKMSGYEVCRRIRQKFKPNELSVILLTAKNQVSDLVTGLESGANDFLTKPISRRELLARVKTHLELIHVTRQLKEAQEKALELARTAGKADFATTVLHNVGNILNSLNVSCSTLEQRVKLSKLEGLVKANELMGEHQNNLGGFFSEERGEKLANYYFKLGDIYKQEQNYKLDELKAMSQRIELMKEIIETQQFHDKSEAAVIPITLDDIIRESVAVQQNALEKYGVSVSLNMELNQPVYAHHTVLVHILVNLIKNAIEAMHDSDPRTLLLETGSSANGTAFCRITDNGEGIEDLGKVFKRGFTTKKYGHGYGLYYCQKAMEAMGGNLSASSEGAGKGASFQLTFTAAEEEEHESAE